jgi:hypothetical protein
VPEVGSGHAPHARRVRVSTLGVMTLAAGRFAAVAFALLAFTMVVSPPANAVVSWHPKTPPLFTPWTHLVGPDNALPEYPRPQMARKRWLNLNGVWGYTGRSADTALPAPPPAEAYREQILVPYPTESALSGIGRHDDQMWYRKVFKMPDNWRGQRVLLHFGAVDQIATVWVNNKQVAHHEGGYTEFSADITDALRFPGAQEITVRVEDRNETNPFPVGKQRNAPGGLFYTGSSGIWQTVWIEPVRAAHIDKLDITSDLGSFTITPRVSGTTDEHAVVMVSAPGRGVVSIKWGKAGQAIRLAIPNPHLWTPDDPYLYDIKVALIRPAGKVVDEVSSYAGLRTIGIVRDGAGRPRIALNGRITFLHGPLDQGYWPDGLYTAPTDAALKFDLKMVKELGMNFVRKHAKVEPARWYYWADKLGLMVWQDMPSLYVSLDVPTGPLPDPPPEAKTNFERELFVDRRLGAVQRGLGRIRHRQDHERREGGGPDAAGGCEQRGELLQIATRQPCGRHLGRPHLCRPRPSCAARPTRPAGDRGRRVRRPRADPRQEPVARTTGGLRDDGQPGAPDRAIRQGQPGPRGIHSRRQLVRRDLHPDHRRRKRGQRVSEL